MEIEAIAQKIGSSTEFEKEYCRTRTFKMNKTSNPRDILFDPEIGVTDESKVCAIVLCHHNSYCSG